LLAALAHHQRQQRAGILEHELAHQLVAALAHAQNIEQSARLELGQGIGTDQTAIGDDAHPGDSKARPQPIDHRNEGRDVSRVARPHLRADWPPVTVDDHCEDHLPQIGPVILAVAVAA
jgi:hypothetical protein